MIKTALPDINKLSWFNQDTQPVEEEDSTPLRPIQDAKKQSYDLAHIRWILELVAFA